MLLTVRRTPVASLHRPVQGAAAPTGSVAFSRYPVPVLRPDQSSVVVSPNTGRPQVSRGGIPATQTDFGAVQNVQNPAQPLFSRYAGPTPVQRLVVPAFVRYPDAYDGWSYPSVVTTGNTGRPQVARGGIPATQTDFAIRVRVVRPGLRWNGLTFAYAALGVAKPTPRPWATYVQPLGMPTLPGPAGSVFPTQYAGLRVQYHGTAHDLCLVATADAPSGIGGQIRINKNGTTYAVYLVTTSDPDATPVRVKTTTGVYAIRQKT